MTNTITEIDHWRHKLHQARVERRLTLSKAAEMVGVTRERFELVEYRRARIQLNTIRSWWAQIEQHQPTARQTIDKALLCS